jgi:hypothetical protein
MIQQLLYYIATFGPLGESAAILRPLKELAATCKVTPCLQSTNNIIVLNAFMAHHLSIIFLSELLQTRTARYTTNPTFLSARRNTLLATGSFTHFGRRW